MNDTQYSGKGKTIEEALSAAVSAAKKAHPSMGEEPVSVDVVSIHAKYGYTIAGIEIVEREVVIKLGTSQTNPGS